MRLSIAAILLIGLTSIAAAGEIRTIAGTGESADSGATGQALETNIGQPFGVEIGPDGALYIAEVQNHRVRRLNLTTGEVTTVAGCGVKGYSGDGGPATEAKLNEPYEIRFDPHGNLYFVEMQNHLVRKVDRTTGVISTVAGTGEAGFGGDGGPATQAQLRQPHSIVLDAHRFLYIADIGNHRIRRVDLHSGEIDTLAGNGEKKLPQAGQPAAGRPILGPRALFLDGRTLWIALREGHSIWTLDLESGTYKHIAGTGRRGYGGDGGSARQATLDGPKGVAIGPDRRVYVVDTENQAIRRIDPGKDEIVTVAGQGPKTRGFGGDGGPAKQAKLDRPHGICVGPDGTIYIGDSENHRVRAVTP